MFQVPESNVLIARKGKAFIVFKHHTMKPSGEVVIKLYMFLSQHKEKVNGQLHAMATLCQSQKPVRTWQQIEKSLPGSNQVLVCQPLLPRNRGLNILATTATGGYE